MVRIVAISGSLRKDSYNTALLRNAQQLLPANAEMEILAIDAVPLFNEDVEKQGAPEIVVTLKDKIAAADGLLVSTPEYNNSIPGVLKNAIDWLSRPNADQARVFHGKPFALMGATPSGFGTLNAQTAWLPLIRYFRFRPCFANSLLVSAAHEKFDEDLQIKDAMVQASLKKFITEFVEFVQQEV